MALLPPALHERLLLAVLLLSGALGAAAGILPSTTTGPESQLARAAALATLFLLVFAYALSRGLQTLRTMGAGSAATEARRYWAFLRNAALTLEVLLLLAVVHLGLVLVTRAVDLPAVTRVQPATTAVLAVLLALAVPAAFYYTLRVPLGPKTAWTSRVSRALLLTFATLAALAIVAIAVRSRIPYPIPLVDTSQVFVAALTLLGIALVPARGLPTPYTILTEPREYYGGPIGAARTRSILVPATIAFSILFVAFFLIVFFGVGQAGIQQPVQLAVIAFILGAMGTSIGLSLRLARSQERRRFETQRLAGEGRAGVAVFLASALLSAVGFGLAGLLYAGVPIGPLPAEAWTDAFAAGLLLGLGPYGYYVWGRERRIQRLEERFPDFLRDVAASHTGGLPITASIRIASKGDYGPLTAEIRAMADQLSWDVPLNEVLRLFAERVGTPLIRRSVGLIIEASLSGGNTSDVLMAAARDARDIKALESQRRSSMGLYTVVVYITFLVFLGVVALLYATLVPQLLEAGGRLAGAGTSGAAGLGLDIPTQREYRVYYFLTAIVQALGNGALVGLLQSGRARLGLRHAFNMVLVTYVTFRLLA